MLKQLKNNNKARLIMNRYQIIRHINENRAVRVIAYPLIKFNHSKTFNKYEKSKYPKMIKELKNSYKGQACFIVGNGPSLRIDDLDKLYSCGVFCFGMNHIYDIFSETKWRPDFYFCYDREFIRSEYKVITTLDVNKIFIEFSKSPKHKIIQMDKIYYYFTDYVFAIKRGTAITNHVCINLEEMASFVTNTTHLCIEFAMYLGFKEIYLVGVDHDYSFGYGHNHARGISEGKHNDKKVFANSDMLVSEKKYMQYKEYAEKNGINIYNATKGGKLEVYPRIGFDEALGKINGNNNNSNT